MKVLILKALYGLKASGNSWFIHLSDTLRQLGFTQSQLDLALWYRLRKDQSGYDYFSHHVDDFLVTGKNPDTWVDQLKRAYTISGGEPPKHHLGMDISSYDCNNKKFWRIACGTYIIEALKNVCDALGIKDPNELGKRCTHFP